MNLPTSGVFWLLHGHGVLAILAFVLGYRVRRTLLGGRENGSKQAWQLLGCMLALFASGVTLYVRYRAPGGVRADLLAHHPLWHTVAFEWKEALGWMAVLLSLTLVSVTARNAFAPDERRLVLPMLAALLVCLLGAAGIGTVLSFFVKAVS
jgi:hypothetical protein